MISLTYSLSVEEEMLFRTIETLRAEILAINITPQHERTTQWQTTLDSVLHTFTIRSKSISKTDISRALEQKKADASSRYIIRILDCLAYVDETWSGDELPISIDALHDIFTRLFPKTTITSREWLHIESTIRTSLQYITNQEHPLVRAAIMTASLQQNTLAHPTMDLYAAIIYHAILAKAGFTCRNLVSPIRGLGLETSSLTTAIQTINNTQNLKHWILFLSQNLKREIERSINIIRHVSSHKDIKNDNQKQYCTERQRHILMLLRDTHGMITNNTVQRRFGVSQVTASRDLSDLLKKQLVFKHGSGRTVRYSLA